MTNSTTKQSLKRLSLLHSPTSSSPSLSPSTSNSPVISSNKSFQLSDVASSSSQKSSIDIPSSSTPAASSPTIKELKNVRRQSTICYFSQDRDREGVTVSPAADASARRFSTQVTKDEGKHADSEKEARELRRKSVQMSGSETEPRDRPPPLTLAEKHADLLRFIAQKESKCLDLRAQLATHESELLQLKRKWERIVSRSAPSGLSSSPNLDADTLIGIRESVQGVGRFIATLGEMGQVSFEDRQRGEHDHGPGHESTSSISTLSSVRFSQSSQSSVSSLGVPGDHTCPASSIGERNDVTVTSFSLLGGSSGSEPVRRLPTSTVSSLTSSAPVFDAKTVRRRSHTPSTPLLSSPHEARPKVTPLRSPTQRHNKQASFVPGALPPPSSIPGISALASASAVPPFSVWVDSVGRTLGQLHAGSGKVHKRASTLLSDASTSLFAALAHVPSDQVSMSVTAAVPVPIPAQSSLRSLLDDDDDDDGGASMLGLGVVEGTSWAGLVPDRPEPSSALLKPSASVTVSGVKSFDDESDEWNW